MKKLLFLLLLIPAISFGQGGWTNPNNSYGVISNGQSIDSCLFFPTGCGAARLQRYDLHKAAIYFDTCGGMVYIYNPKLKTWKSISVGSNILSPGVDSFLIPAGALLDKIEIIDTSIINVDIGKSIGSNDIAIGVPVLNGYTNFELDYFSPLYADTEIYFSNYTINTITIIYLQ